MIELREQIEPFFKAPPDKTLSFVAEMDMGVPEGVPVVDVCPMHPEVASEEPSSCPKCGMKLLAQAAEETTYVCPMHLEVTSDKPDRCPKCGMKLLPQASWRRAAAGHEHQHGHGHEADHQEERHGGEGHAAHDDHEHHGGHHDQHGESEHAHNPAQGIEWEDDMVEVNRKTTPANMRWKLVDRDTGAENAQIDWTFHIGDQVKLRLVNEMDSRPSDAAPVPCPRSRTVPDPCARRRGRAGPRLEGHGARPHRRDRRHPSRRHEPWTLDGSSPHRRSPRSGMMLSFNVEP